MVLALSTAVLRGRTTTLTYQRAVQRVQNPKVSSLTAGKGYVSSSAEKERLARIMWPPSYSQRWKPRGFPYSDVLLVQSTKKRMQLGLASMRQDW